MEDETNEDGSAVELRNQQKDGKGQKGGDVVSAVGLPKQPEDAQAPKQPEPVGPLSRAEFERMLAERETRWQEQLEEIKQGFTLDVAAVQLWDHPTAQPQEPSEQEPAEAETDAERQTRADKAAQRARAAAQTRQAVEGFGTTGTLPVNGSAAPHNPIAHIDDPRELYRLARRELEHGRKGK